MGQLRADALMFNVLYPSGENDPAQALRKQCGAGCSVRVVRAWFVNDGKYGTESARLIWSVGVELCVDRPVREVQPGPTNRYRRNVSMRPDSVVKPSQSSVIHFPSS